MENALKDERVDAAAAGAACDGESHLQVPIGLWEAATSALFGEDVLVSFAPKGGIVAGGVGHELLERAHNMPAACRMVIEEKPDEIYALYFDQSLPGINAWPLSEVLLFQLKWAKNAYVAVFLIDRYPSEIGEAFFNNADDSFMDQMRIAIAQEFVFLFSCALELPNLKDSRYLIEYRSIFRVCQDYLQSQDIEVEPIIRRADLAALLEGEGPYTIEAPPIITSGAQDIPKLFAEEGIEVGGRVIVSVPGERPYIRPSGWMSDGRTVWRPGEGEFPFSATHDGDPDTLRSRGRIFRRHLGEFIEGSVAEETDYVLTGSRAIQSFILNGWPWVKGLSERGYNPFARGPAAPIGQRHVRGQALPSDITGIDIEDLAGQWTFAGALRTYVTSRGKPPKPGTSFRDLDLSRLTLAVTQQDFADTDILRAARRRLIGFLGPRVVMAPEVLRLSGFKVDPLNGQPLDGSLRSDPALILRLLEEDLEHLIRLRMSERDVAIRGKDPIDVQRIDGALKLTTRDCIRPRVGPSFGNRLREDLRQSLARHEAAMQAKGAELIYVAKGDDGYEPAELVRVPYQLGWLPGPLFALPEDAGPQDFDRAARLAARVLGFEPFINLPLNERSNDDGDALLAVDDLAEDEVLFSEFAFHMGSREFRRRVSVLAANGVSDLVAPTWRKNDVRNGYAADRFSPFNAGPNSPWRCRRDGLRLGRIRT